MKYKPQFIKMLRFALGLVLMIGAFAPQALAPNEDPQWTNLETYLVTWHATGRGLGHETAQPDVVTEKEFWETTGSAIIRFKRAGGGNLLLRDTRYLSLLVVDSRKHWTKVPPNNIGCDEYTAEDVVDPSKYSGLYISLREKQDPANPMGLPFPDISERQDGRTVFRRPFANLWGYFFTIHTISTLTPTPGATCSNTPQENTFRSGGHVIFPDTQEQEQQFVLQAVNPKDDSYLSMNVRFSTQTGHGGINSGIDYSMQVEWTAEAHRLGTCPCALNSN